MMNILILKWMVQKVIISTQSGHIPKFGIFSLRPSEYVSGEANKFIIVSVLIVITTNIFV